jgi:hypothetical protein
MLRASGSKAIPGSKEAMMMLRGMYMCNGGVDDRIFRGMTDLQQVGQESHKVLRSRHWVGT